MKIPLQTEVSKYMKDKKDWPQKFCDYYAERFWNFYQSNGWKVSGKGAMKDWKAAFNSQWQTLKFKEDIEFLNGCAKDKKEVAVLVEKRTPIERLRDLFCMWRKDASLIKEETYLKLHDWLAKNNMLYVEQDQEETVQKLGKTDEKKKVMRVKFYFLNVGNKEGNFFINGKQPNY